MRGETLNRESGGGRGNGSLHQVLWRVLLLQPLKRREKRGRTVGGKKEGGKAMISRKTERGARSASPQGIQEGKPGSSGGGRGPPAARRGETLTTRKKPLFSF